MRVLLTVRWPREATRLAGLLLLLTVVGLSPARVFACTEARGDEDGGVPALEYACAQIHVVDERGRDVAGATVTPQSMRVQDRWYEDCSWPDQLGGPIASISNQTGMACLLYPRCTTGERCISEITFRVDHAEFCRKSACCLLDRADVTTVTLQRGVPVQLNVRLGGKRVRPEEVYVVVGGSGGWRTSGDIWQSTTSGELTTSRLPPGRHHLMVIHVSPDGVRGFSPSVVIDVSNDQKVERDLQLKPGVSVTGVLDETVPRPVQNGKVLARFLPGGGVDWRACADIEPSGRFVLEAVPPGDVELVALCDGYVSRGEKGVPCRDLQSFAVGRPDAQRVVLRMEQTAGCVVKVTDGQGAPLAGAMVYLSPNIEYDAYSIGFDLRACSPVGSGSWRGLAYTDRGHSCDANNFCGRTDEHGRAAFRGLPGCSVPIDVTHTRYCVSGMSGADALEPGPSYVVNLAAGENAEVVVTMENGKSDPPNTTSAQQRSEDD